MKIVVLSGYNSSAVHCREHGDGNSEYREALAELRAMTLRARSIVGRGERHGYGALADTTRGALRMYTEALGRSAERVIAAPEFVNDARAPRTIESAWATAKRCRLAVDA